mgnify:CR=1 FL=1
MRMKQIFGCISLAFAALLLATDASADPLGGRKTFGDTIGRDMEQHYDIILKKEELTMIQVTGAGRSDLDCYLYDEENHLVDSDEDPSDRCLLKVTPRWTGHFDIVIRNVGGQRTSYRGSAY